MKKEEIQVEVSKILVEHLGVDSDKIKDDSDFVSDLGADSLDAVEIIMAIEEHFDIEIPDEEAETMTTVQKTVDVIIAKLA